MDGWITYKIMKAQFLKISGHKNEKDFYKEFPNIDSFMAKHGAALKKAQNGLQTDTNNNGVPDYLEQVNPNQAMQQYQQLFPAGKMPTQMGPQMGVSQNANQTFANFNSGFNTGGQGFGEMFKGAFSGGDYGNGGMGKAFGDIGKSFGIGGGGSGGAGGSSGGMGGGGMGNAGGYIEAIMSIGKGIGALKGEKKMKKNAYRDRDVVQIVRDAYDSKDVNQRQNYMDNTKRMRQALIPTVDADALFPTYGVGTNVLAKDGKKLKGKKANHGEIMNTFAPGTIYDDLGYSSTFQPMTDVEQVKSYTYGGKLKAQNGGNFNWDNLNNTMAMISQNNQTMSLGNKYAPSSNIGKFDNAGGQIGSGIGQAVGTFFGGPLGGMVGKWAGKYVGGAVDPNYRKIKGANYMKEDDINYMTRSSGFQSARAQSVGAYTKDGGIINPQVIKYFGNNTVSSLFKPDPSMDTLRTGGHIRSNSVGDVEALSGGYLEPISYNPHTSGTGVTSMIQGQSHDESNGRHSGVILDYNGKHVEAERGEPVSERQDGGSVGDSAVIAGDQTFNKIGSSIMPHLAKYEGKKIKNIQKEIAEKDAKLNKFDSKNAIALSDFAPRTAIDKLTMNSYTKNAEGIQQKYKINAREVDDLLAYQAATNDTAKVMGVNAGDLSRGRIKHERRDVAQSGTVLPTGAKGNTDPNATFTNTTGLLDYTPVGPGNSNPLFSSEDVYAKFKADTEKAYDNPEIAKQLVDYFTNYQGQDWQDVRAAIAKGTSFEEKRQIAKKLATDHFPGRFHVNISDVTAPKLEVKDATGNDPKLTGSTVKTPDGNYEVTPYKGNVLETVLGQVAPWFRRPPGMDLQTNQIAGELGSLGDTPDPVQARFYHPNLANVSDVSYQDQLNENQADFNQLIKASGNNPEALGALAAQKYAANSKVLGEQFRANQTRRDTVYGQNTNTLNDALLKNLSIADQQYVRQSQAKSNTKEIRRAAMDSIASKTLQNQLENRKLQVASNEFKDFSFDSGNRLNKTGVPTAFSIPQNYIPDSSKATHLPVYDVNGNISGYKAVDKAELKSARNGSIVKAFREL